MRRLYRKFHVSYVANLVLYAVAIPICLVWPGWSLTTSLIVNTALLPVNLGLVYYERRYRGSTR